jgi:hypothetical protein
LHEVYGVAGRAQGGQASRRRRRRARWRGGADHRGAPRPRRSSRRRAASRTAAGQSGAPATSSRRRSDSVASRPSATPRGVAGDRTAAITTALTAPQRGWRTTVDSSAGAAGEPAPAAASAPTYSLPAGPQARGDTSVTGYSAPAHPRAAHHRLGDARGRRRGSPGLPRPPCFQSYRCGRCNGFC